jgi:hypothetical protein
MPDAIPFLHLLWDVHGFIFEADFLRGLTHGLFAGFFPEACWWQQTVSGCDEACGGLRSMREWGGERRHK